jgi:hypothetical protein
MSSSEPKNSAIAQKRAEFEAQRKERADARELEREGHEEARRATTEANEKLGEAGTYREWTIVYDPQSHANYYYNNFSGACVWEEPDDFKVSTKTGRPIAAIKLWAARRMQAVFRGRRGRFNALMKRAEEVYEDEQTHTHGDWVEAYDPHHHAKYYYNHSTHDVSWEPPEGWVATEFNTIDVDKHAAQQRYNGAAPVRMWRPRAATKIQSVYRGHLARRHVHAIRENKRLQHIRKPKMTEEVPKDQDFSGAGEYAREEMRRLGDLLHENNQRVKKMEENISNHSHVVEVKDAKINQLKKRMAMDQEEMQSLEKRLEQEEHDFEELVKLTKAKEKEIEEKNEELKRQLEQITGHEKELDRHKTIIRRQEKELDALNPDTEEVCLSARSFSENMVISLRDEAIEAKEKQIAILNGQNEKLLANLDSLESEIHNMQKDLLSKEKVIQKKTRYGEHLEHKIDKLERDLQKKGGEEAAIEVTNRQNAQLLQLLQVHETKTEELESIKIDLKGQIQGVAERHTALMHQAAEWEAKNLRLEAENIDLTKKLSTGAITWEGQRAQMEAEVSETKSMARVRIDAMQEELRTRREKQYSLLERLQAAEESMRASEDECERLRETVNVVQERLYELDAQLIQAKQWRTEDKSSQHDLEKHLKQQLRNRDAEIKRQIEASGGIKRQLQEMAATVLQLVEKNKEADQRMQEEGKKVGSTQARLETLQTRISGLIKEGTKEGKMRVQAETTIKVLHEQMSELRRGNRLLTDTAKNNISSWEEKETNLKRRLAAINARLHGEQRARRSAVVRIIDRRITTRAELDEREQRDPSAGTTVDLSNLGLTDDEVSMISPLFGKESLLARRFETLNLSYNRLGDKGANALASLIRSGTFLETINVSGNTISGEGIRALAEGLSGSGTLGIKHVYVHKDGKVQGLGVRNQAWVTKSPNSITSADVLDSPRTAETVLTVDMRNNVAPESAQLSEYEMLPRKKLPGIKRKTKEEIIVEEKKMKDDKFLERVYGGESNLKAGEKEHNSSSFGNASKETSKKKKPGKVKSRSKKSEGWISKHNPLKRHR